MREIRQDTTPAHPLLYYLDRLLLTLNAGDYILDIPTIEARVRPDHDHFHMHPEVFVQTGGMCLFSFPRVNHLLKPGHILIIPPMVSHAEKAIPDVENRFQNLVFIAHESSISFHTATHRDQRPVIRESVTVNCDGRVIIRNFEKSAGVPEDPLRQVRARNCLMNAFLAFRDSVAGFSVSTRPVSLPELCLRLIRRHLENPELNVRWLAAETGYSADYLSNLFAESEGRTLTDCINSLRIERARDLLIQTALNSSEIAWACGYGNAAYFNRQFKKRTGTTPLNYRRQTLTADSSPTVSFRSSGSLK